MNGLLARAFLSSELLSVKSTVHKAHHPHVSVSSVADSDEVDKDRKLLRRSEGGEGQSQTGSIQRTNSDEKLRAGVAGLFWHVLMRSHWALKLEAQWWHSVKMAVMLTGGKPSLGCEMQ